jgi:signal transduction histidine kinase
LAGSGLNHAAGFEGMDPKRMDAVEETLATLSNGSESLRGIAHDARNMVTALGLYCELLEEPGVLSAPFVHYGSELRMVATASRRLVEKLVALETPRTAELPSQKNLNESENTSAGRQDKHRRWEMVPALPIASLAADVLANRNLLATLAGPAVTVSVEAQEGDQPVHLTSEDLTRVLVNLVKNASEAMSARGRIEITLRESGSGDEPRLTLLVEDNGPGIPAPALDKIFLSGYSTRGAQVGGDGAWPTTHRGLGLSISRSILEAAGGRIYASNRPRGGARFEIELPVRTC